jgi:hypothetical protein
MYNSTCVDDLTASEVPLVTALADRVSVLKELGIIGVSVAANWMVHRVTPLKKQVHLGWEYSAQMTQSEK